MDAVLILCILGWLVAFVLVAVIAMMLRARNADDDELPGKVNALARLQAEEWERYRKPLSADELAVMDAQNAAYLERERAKEAHYEGLNAQMFEALKGSKVGWWPIAPDQTGAAGHGGEDRSTTPSNEGPAREHAQSAARPTSKSQAKRLAALKGDPHDFYSDIVPHPMAPTHEQLVADMERVMEGYPAQSWRCAHCDYVAVGSYCGECGRVRVRG